jgi:hypothetical protein
MEGCGIIFNTPDAGHAGYTLNKGQMINDDYVGE